MLCHDAPGVASVVLLLSQLHALAPAAVHVSLQ